MLFSLSVDRGVDVRATFSGAEYGAQKSNLRLKNGLESSFRMHVE
jgi:hypothetical protein